MEENKYLKRHDVSLKILALHKKYFSIISLTNKHNLFSDIEEKSDSESDTDSEMDLDMTVDFMSLSGEAQVEINTVGKNYDLGRSDFVKFLARDIEEAQEMRTAKQEEEEKAMFSVSCSTIRFL